MKPYVKKDKYPMSFWTVNSPPCCIAACTFDKNLWLVIDRKLRNFTEDGNHLVLYLESTVKKDVCYCNHYEISKSMLKPIRESNTCMGFRP